jgi:hypothetical protein
MAAAKRINKTAPPDLVTFIVDALYEADVSAT